jgi:hypothetical protein
VDILRREASIDEQSRGESGNIDVRFRPAAIDERFGIGIRSTKLIDDFLTHLEATDSDRRAEPCLRNRGVELCLAREHVERLRRDL